MERYDFDELGADLEQIFDITLDERVDQLETVGELVLYIHDQLLHGASEAANFHAHIMQGVVEAVGGDAANFGADAPTKKAFPWYKRKSQWRHLERVLDMKLPALRDKNTIMFFLAIIFVVTLGVFAGGHYLDMLFSLPESLFILLVLVVGLPLGFLVHRYTAFLKMGLPDNCALLGDLADRIASMNAIKLHRELLPPRDKTTTSDPFLAPRRRCTYVAAFLALRRAFCAHANISTRAIKLDTPLSTLVAANGRKRVWRETAEKLDLFFPLLERPGWLVALCVALFLLSLGLILVYSSWTWMDAVGTTMGYGALFGYAAYFATIPFAVRIPTQCTTMGEFSNEVLKMNYGKIARSNHSVHADEIWRVMEGILVWNMGRAAGEITLESPLTKLEE